MKIGIVGYQGSGKSTLFELLTQTSSDPSLAHTTQTAMAAVPDDRIDKLCEIYSPKKVVTASIELVDTPGLSRTHEGSAARLGLIREAECLALVVSSFDGSDPLADLRTFEEDVLLADLELLTGRVERLRESVRKPRPNREAEQAELDALEPLLASLEEGQALREMQLTEEQVKATRSFRLITEKPRLVVVNVADDEDAPERFTQAKGINFEVVAAPLGLELELAKMTAEDRAEFEAEIETIRFDRGDLLRRLLDLSGRHLFFTASDKEVRSWLLKKGGTALAAADGIHSDLARGFIRAETMHIDDLVRLGSEREIKAAGLMRQEPKDYVVKSGDILHIRFNV